MGDEFYILNNTFQICNSMKNINILYIRYITISAALIFKDAKYSVALQFQRIIYMCKNTKLLR